MLRNLITTYAPWTTAINPMVIGVIVGVLVLGGTYMYGHSNGVDSANLAIATERQQWRDQVQVAQSGFRDAVKVIVAANTERTAQLEQQLEILRDKKQRTKLVTKYVPITVDTPVANGLVQLHDRSARGQKLDQEVVNAAGQSKYKQSDLGAIVSENYYQCNATTAQLEQLQAIIRKYQAQQNGMTK